MYEILTITLFVTIIIQGVYNIRLSKLQRMRINALYTKLGEEQDEVQAAKIGLTDYRTSRVGSYNQSCLTKKQRIGLNKRMRYSKINLSQG
jgi:hypothetical protein